MRTGISFACNELVGTYFKYVFAFILTALSVELGNILDGVMVGQIIGPDAVAAVGTTLPLLQGYYSVYVLFGGGERPELIPAAASALRLFAASMLLSPKTA